MPRPAARFVAPHLFAALLFALPALGHQLTGRVVAVADGDTITVLDAARHPVKIRLSGIDAPEKKQPYGTRARQHLSELVFGKVVEIDWQKHDRYGRIIGRVIAPEEHCAATICAMTVDAGLAQLTAGLAWHYKQYAKEQPRAERERYAAAEQEAHIKHLGLWADPRPVPPWDWRHHPDRRGPAEGGG